MSFVWSYRMVPIRVATPSGLRFGYFRNDNEVVDTFEYIHLLVSHIIQPSSLFD